MPEKPPIRVSVADLIKYTSATIEDVWAMFADNSVRFYRGSTLLTFEKTKTPITPSIPNLACPIEMSEQEQREFEAGFLLPDLDDEEDILKLSVVKMDVIAWFEQRGQDFVVADKIEPLWRGANKMISYSTEHAFRQYDMAVAEYERAHLKSQADALPTVIRNFMHHINEEIAVKLKETLIK